MEVRIACLMSDKNPGANLGTRISIFFSAASLSGAFSGLLAFGIIKMHGVGNKPGWAWIFIVEGLFTVAFGFISFFFLPKDPAHARFLNGEEKAYIAAKLKEDGAIAKDDGVDEFSWSEVAKAFLLPQVWIIAVIFFMDGTSSPSEPLVIVLTLVAGTILYGLA